MEALDRKIGKPGEERGKVIAHRDSQPKAGSTTERIACAGKDQRSRTIELLSGWTIRSVKMSEPLNTKTKRP